MAVDDLRRVSWRLALLTLLPLCVLAWLAVGMLAGERDAERQRHADRLRLIADRLAVDIQRRMQELEETQASVRLTPAGPQALNGTTLLYGPTRPASQWWDEPALAEAERLEFDEPNPQAAARLYRQAARRGDAPTRAHALAALTRVLRQQHAYGEALEATRALEGLGATLVAGHPAALLAHQARLRLYAEQGDRTRLARAAMAFAAAAYDGRWALDRAGFEEARQAILAAGGPPPPALAVARTRAAFALWQEWQQGRLPTRGRRLLDDPTAPVLAAWGGGTAAPQIWFGSLDDLQRTWLPVASQQGASLSAFSVEGRHLFGPRGGGGISVTPAETRVPVVLHVALPDGIPDPVSRSRQRVVAAVLGGAFLLLVGVAWSLSRTTHRELSLARQQTEFVAAVSHEFRTPLTSMRHLLDLLSTRPVPAERRAHYYGLLIQESDRLQRMVETLLTFGRLEAGAHGWRMQPVIVRTLLDDVVDTFRREPLSRGRDVSCTIGPGAEQIVGDAEALARALWNLVENAAKYSPPGSPIALSAMREGDAVRLTVADQGPGIEAADRHRIFGKFQRGRAAIHDGVRGVGIGLALVRLIAEGHGGSVSLTSVPGRGSAFTMTCPSSRERHDEPDSRRRG